jgi:hypothetical protein
MDNTIVCILFFIAIIVGPFLLIWLLDKQVKTKGALFTGPVTFGMRILALILGVAFGWLSLGIGLEFVILSIALIGYSFGFDKFLRRLQGEKKYLQNDMQERLNGQLKHNRKRIRILALRTILLAIFIAFVVYVVVRGTAGVRLLGVITVAFSVLLLIGITSEWIESS